MHQIDGFLIRGDAGKRIELWQGDLTEWPEGSEMGALVVSAFRGDYTPTEASLIGALHRKGVSVEDLAARKDVDALEQYNCWLSTPLPPQLSMPYRHILCFEPHSRGKAPELVGDIFRALVPISYLRPGIRSIAMPILGAGDQRYPVAAMLPPLLEAAIHWLEEGLPLHRIAIVTHSERQADLAQEIFAKHRQAYLKSVDAAPEAFDFDVFVSYSHANGKLADSLIGALTATRPGVRIFRDREELNLGAAWQTKIFQCLSRSKKVVALLSPDYVKSKACQEEFNIAWIRARRTGEHVLLPVYGYTAKIPDWMLFWQYVDCREGDDSRLDLVVAQVLGALDEQPAVSPYNAAAASWTTAQATSAVESADRMPCPRCAESIKKAATMCRYCSLELTPPGA